ncbi:MAG: N-6 DNA methylase [Caldilineaceae bacterium]
MEQAQLHWIRDFIWGIADDVLRDVYGRGKYRDAILPMTLMFLVNKLSKMKRNTGLGSRIAEVHNGSSLFTGDAGQGESNIRRWLIEEDWLEAIIALPLNIFYNTGIATYVWVLSNRKPAHRRGYVQLIDATKIGYEIPFTRYFYKPQPLPTLAELRTKRLALEREGEGLLGEILGQTEGQS